jgi:uncharacterized damage-inducible protein DinB
MMRLQDFLAESTDDALQALFRNAEAIPIDKLTWQPAPEARSVLDQLQECAQVPAMFKKVLKGEMVEFTPETLVYARRERREWTTVDECRRVCEFNTKSLCEDIRHFPDDRMNQQIMLPWGESVTILKLLTLHHWNMVWHTGQIAYIQRLLGDKEMH